MPIFASVGNGTLKLQWDSAEIGTFTANFSGSYWITEAAPAPPSPVEITTICPVDQPVLDEPYSYQFEATGGKKPYTWSIISGSLPTGLTLNSALGIISGTPTDDGSFPYTLQVSDASEPPLTASIDCEFVIAPTPSSFDYYSDFVVNADQVPSTQSEFPVGIVWTDDRFKSISNGGHVASIDGFDIRPYDPTGTTPRTFELVWYDPTTGSFEMWVLMPSIDDADVIRMKYGNPSLVADGSSPTTWPSSYGLVQHYGSPTTLTLEDSTSNGNDGTGFNTPTASAGQLGGAVNLELASSQYVEVPDAALLRCSNTDSMTWEFWIYRTGSGPLNQFLFDKKGAGPSYTGWDFRLQGGGAADIFRGRLISDFGGGDYIANNILAFTIATGWTYLVVTYDGSGLNTGLNFWRNDIAAPMDRHGSLTGSSSSTAALDIGAEGGATFFDGKFDEVRISKGVVRSDDYKTTSYNNQVSMAGFWTLDTEVVT